MQKFARLTLASIGGLLLLAAVVLLALNLYVQSQGTQARIQRELRQRLGATLTIGRISVTPWSGLKCSGITIAQSPGGAAGNFLEAKNFGLRISLLSLFSRRLVIKEASLVEPNVVWPQNADGKWRLPDLRGDRGESKTVSAPATTSVEKQSGDSERETVAPAPSKKLSVSRDETKKNAQLISEIRRIDIKNGSFRFLGRNGEPVANFAGVGFRANISGASALHGFARVDKLAVRDRVFVEQLKSPLRYDDNGLGLSQVSARIGNGDLSGSFSIQPETDEAPFRVETKFRNVDADQIITEAGGPPGVLQGKLEGNLEVTGKTADADALQGSGQIVLHDGQLRQYNLLVALGEIFQIEELTQLHLDQADAKYHLEPGVVQIDELILRSPNIHLSGTGTVGFGGKLHLDSRLAINEKVRAQLFKPIRTNFQPTEEPGYSSVDFQVTGTIERPKTNLLEKVVGRDLKDLVNSFWGGKTEKPKKKKRNEANASGSESTESEASPASPAPSPTASP